MEGDSESMTDLGIVSGDLVHVISTVVGGQADNTTTEAMSVSESVSKASTGMACSSDSEIIKPDVARMETDTVSEHCIEWAVNSSADGDRTTESCRTALPYATSAEEQQVVNRYLNEPIVVREATDHSLPQTLVLAYSLIQPQTADAALLVVLDVLMSELGYQRITECDPPVDWDLASGSTFLNYTYPALPSVKFQLLCVRMLRQLIVHGLVRMSDDVIQKRTRLQLTAADFIKTDADGSFTYHCSRLSQLSRTFKDSTAYPMLQFAMHDGDTVAVPSFATLVNELKMHIMKYLKVESLVQLSAVNRDFNCVARQPILWRRLYIKDFGRRTEMSLDQDWISLYKDEYGRHKKIRHHVRHWEFPPVLPFMGPTVPDYPPAYPRCPPGFIGGDYDLRPNVALDPLRLPDPLRLSRHLAPDSVLDPTSALEDQLPSVLAATAPASLTSPGAGSGRSPVTRPFVNTAFRYF